METIWKYRLDGVRTELEMPEGARILSVQAQNDIPCLWAYIPDTNRPRVRRVFEFLGTGYEMPQTQDISLYLGTVLLCGGELVVHVFETSPHRWPGWGKR